MWFMFPHTIRGWFMEVRSWRGRDGTRIPESGLAAHTFRLASASESDGSEVLVGVGDIGDSIGITITPFLTMPGTIPGAGHFITGTLSTEAEGPAAEHSPAGGTGPPTRVSAVAPDLPIVPVQLPGPSRETPRLREGTPHPAVKRASNRVPSATTTTAARRGIMRRAEAPASAVEDSTAAAGAAADIVNRGFVLFPVNRRI